MVGSALSGQTDLPKPPPASNTDLKPSDKSGDVDVPEGKGPAVPGENAEENTDDEESESGDDSEDEEEEKEEDNQDANKLTEKKAERVEIVKNVPSLEQEMLVDMAFANDDVVAQFKEEKEKIVDEETEKV